MDIHRRWVLELEEGFSPPNCEVGLGLHERLSRFRCGTHKKMAHCPSESLLTWDPTTLVR